MQAWPHLLYTYFLMQCLHFLVHMQENNVSSVGNIVIVRPCVLEYVLLVKTLNFKFIRKNILKSTQNKSKKTTLWSYITGQLFLYYFSLLIWEKKKCVEENELIEKE